MSDKQLTDLFFPPPLESLPLKCRTTSQKRDGSRAPIFEEEKPFLLLLPPRSVESAIWKVATVEPNDHISVENMNNPHPIRKNQTDSKCRITKGAVEIFFDGNCICSHAGIYGRANQNSTMEDHMRQTSSNTCTGTVSASPHGRPCLDIRLKRSSVPFMLDSRSRSGYKACKALLKLTADTLRNAQKMPAREL